MYRKNRIVKPTVSIAFFVDLSQFRKNPCWQCEGERMILSFTGDDGESESDMILRITGYSRPYSSQSMPTDGSHFTFEIFYVLKRYLDMASLFSTVPA